MTKIKKIINHNNKLNFSPVSSHGQGIVAAPKAYFAKQSMERKPGFCRRQKWPKRKTNPWPKSIELINELDGGIEVNCKKMNIRGNDNCRQIPSNITSDNETNTIIQKSDVVYVAGAHIGICDEGNILASFGNDYLSSEKRQDRYFNVIHNYGTENVRLSNDTLCTKSFFCKTIEGPANHWNLNTLNYSRIYLWN